MDKEGLLKGDLVIGHKYLDDQHVETHIGYLRLYRRYFTKALVTNKYYLNCYDTTTGGFIVVECDEVTKAVVVPKDYITEVERVMDQLKYKIKFERENNLVDYSPIRAKLEADSGYKWPDKNGTYSECQLKLL